MTNPDFQDLVNKLKEEIKELAAATFKNYKKEAINDGLNLLKNMEENLKTWTIMLVDGKLSPKDYEFLVLGQQELIEMNALKNTGIALIKIDQFKNSLLNLVINSVIDLCL